MQSLSITTKVVSLNPADGEVYSIQHYVIKFVSDLQQVGGFLQFPPTNKTDRHDITGTLLKVVLNTISLTLSCCTRHITLLTIVFTKSLTWKQAFQYPRIFS